MIRCSYCGGVSEMRRSCQNCAAPLMVDTPATFYNPDYINESMLSGKPGELIAISPDYPSDLRDMMMSVAGVYPVLIGQP